MLQVKELRNRADEGARNKMIHENEGIVYTVPLSGQHLEHLLNTIGTLYGNDDLGLSLMLEYWCPTSGDLSNERFPARQVALSKFVRLTGDLLMPSLFKPYVEMLVSLSGHPQAALHCFNLLKSNVGSSTVSWDHFFNSLHQYFANLRQESQYSTMDTIYRVAARPMTRGISPAEVYGLVSVLRLITSVSSQSEMARIAIAENPSWQPILVLVGLLSCSVPAILKSEVLKTLAALAKTPEIGQVIWLSLESAQLIVQSGPGIGSRQPTQHYGLLNELQDVECRNEEYPLSRAFLSLLDVLLGNKSASVPATVSVHPYVAFVRDQVTTNIS
jgi:nuclear pore complex protein Nup205